MNAFELLENDHKKVSQLFKEIESANGHANLIGIGSSPSKAKKRLKVVKSGSHKEGSKEIIQACNPQDSGEEKDCGQPASGY